MHKRKFMIELRHWMFAPGRTSTFSHLLTLLWLIPWVLTIPLFHVHALLDIQDTRFSPQAFLFHTVFTPDLPGEYSSPPVMPQRGMPGHQSALASHFPHYSELGFNLLSEDDSTKRRILNRSVHYGQPSFLVPSSLETVQYEIPELASPPLLLLASSVCSRAPPFIFS